MEQALSRPTPMMAMPMTVSSSPSPSPSPPTMIEYPTAQTIPFPYPQLYPPQRDFIQTLLDGIRPSPTTTTTTTKVLLLESPTGTGKSLSLACASLAWLEYMQSTASSVDATATATATTDAGAATRTISVPSTCTTTSSTPSNTTGLSWLDEWQPPSSPRASKEELLLQEKQQLQEQTRQIMLQDTLNRIRSQIRTTTKAAPGSHSLDHRLNVLRQDMTKAQLQTRKRLKQQKQQQHKKKSKPRTSTPHPTLQYEPSDDEQEHQTLYQQQQPQQESNPSDSVRSSSSRSPPHGTPEWLLHRTGPGIKGDGRTSTTLSTSSTPTSHHQHPPPPPPQQPYKIVYAARTHSQLSQFIGEVQRTHWGTSVRVVTVASRSQGLCGYSLSSNRHNNNNNKSTSSSMSEAALAEQCHELRNKTPSKQQQQQASSSSSSCACPYYQSSAMATLAIHSLAAPLDLEDMVTLGKSTKTCAYYATRHALPHAQLIVLPYTLLIDRKARHAIGIDDDCLAHSLVLIDEAHNLPAAIQAATSAKISKAVLQASQRQLDRYTQKYMNQLSSLHMKWLGQLKVFLKGLERSLKLPTTPAPQEQLHRSTSSRLSSSSPPVSLQSISQFLCEHKLESINLFPILRYLHDSRLSQKLLGFMDPKQKETKTTDPIMKQQQQQPLFKEIPGTTDTTSRATPVEILPATGAADTTGESTTTATSAIPVHISPMSIVETFLEKLNAFDPTHAKLVVSPKNELLELVVLNPSVHAQDDLYSKPHALCLVGGTLQPFSVLIDELVPQLSKEASLAQSHILQQQQQQQALQNGRHHAAPLAIGDGSSACYTSNKLIGFSCGHVVDKDHVLLQCLSHVNSTMLDLRHGSRSHPSILQAIGSAILSICEAVPYGGVVVFVPSYSYEKVLVEAWSRLTIKRTKDKEPPGNDAGVTTNATIWNVINNVKTIFREPKHRNHLDATLNEFSQQAQRGGDGGGGALLIAVVGGKLSEGINFANDMCRCVVMVGLPYADKSDPVLQDKLKYMPNPQQFYQSLCLRAVNQSVGRAIRHAKDYAAIVVMDPRYARDDGIAHGLPQWLTASTPHWRSQDGRLDTVTKNLSQFFRNPKFQPDQCK